MAEKKQKKVPAAKEDCAPELEDVATLIEPENGEGSKADQSGGDAAQMERLTRQIAELQAEKAQISDQLLRVAAEYDNFRKRSTKEKEALYGEAICDTVCAVLQVLDNLERAVGFADSNPEALKDGLTMTLNTLLESLKRLGLKEIDASGAFDPALHDAVMHVEDESLPENTIVEVLQKGYMVGDRVARHAMVKVAN